MGTIVTIDVPDHAVPPSARSERDEAVDRAFEWFREVERICTRFGPDSELVRLSARPGVAIAVSSVLFEATRFALAVAEATDGAFDPTIGLTMERRGFNREHRTGEVVTTAINEQAAATYRDVAIDERRGTITLQRPLLLDLGAVAKGMAIDLASRELAPFEHFGIDAGGDLYLAGHNADGEPWLVGIRHPNSDETLLSSVRVSDRAVCTSGNYERRGSDPDAGHIINPTDGVVPTSLVSATVVAPSAMLADALATAAFVLGPDSGRQLLDDHGVCGLLFTSNLDRLVTRGCGSDAIVFT